MKKRFGSIGALLAITILAGCSQVGALTPVGGTPITSVRNATNNVLIEQGVEILVAPVCEKGTEAFTCIGSTVDGREIMAEGGLTAPYELRVTVGGEEIFTGTAQEVLNEAVLESS